MPYSTIILEFTTLPTNLINYFQTSKHIIMSDIDYKNYTIMFSTPAPYLTILHIHNNFLNILLSE